MEWLKEWFAVIAGGVGLVLWLGRLEAGMHANRRDIQRLEKQRAEDLERAEKHEIQVDAKLDAIHKDIRDILVAMANKADR